MLQSGGLLFTMSKSDPCYVFVMYVNNLKEFIKPYWQLYYELYYAFLGNLKY